MNKVKPLLQKYRLSVITAVILFVLIWANVFMRVDVLGLMFGIDNYKAEAVYMVVGAMAVIALFLNKYLSVEDQNNSSTNINIENLGNNEIMTELFSKSERKFDEEIEDIKRTLDKTREELLRKAGDSFNQEQRDELVRTLKEQLLEVSSEDLLNDLRDKTNQIIKRQTSERLKSHFKSTITRLSSEINALGKRSRVNLIIGSLTAFAGVSIFMLFVLKHADNSTADIYLAKEFAPRISLVIVIELFAYFFLGLYKNNLSEIKYFHNELTNVEHKHMALEEALASADKDTVKEIVKDFAKTERNFLLKKGESTVSLEDRRVTLEEQNGVINALVNRIGRSSKKIV